jgi:hypothetical protein
MWHSDAENTGIVARERWQRVFAEASNRRLLGTSKRPGVAVMLVTRVAEKIEQMYNYLSPGRFSTPEPEDETVAMPDADIVRLLSLLTPDTDSLQIERVTRGRAPDGRLCSPTVQERR